MPPRWAPMCSPQGAKPGCPTGTPWAQLVPRAAGVHESRRLPRQMQMKVFRAVTGVMDGLRALAGSVVQTLRMWREPPRFRALIDEMRGPAAALTTSPLPQPLPGVRGVRALEMTGCTEEGKGHRSWGQAD